MLSPVHREALAFDGYTVVPGLVPDPMLRAARDIICDSLSADLEKPESWPAETRG